MESVKRKYIVTSILALGNNVMIRLIAEEQPFEGAEHCEPGVEDAYMYLMQGRGGILCS